MTMLKQMEEKERRKWDSEERKDESVTRAQDKIAKSEMRVETQRKRDFIIY